MNANLKKFVDTLIKDEKLQKDLSLAKSPEEAYKIASGSGDGFTKEEFETAMTQIKMEVNKIQGVEITDEDLESVAGGWGPGDWYIAPNDLAVLSTGIAGVSAAVAAAAAI